MIWFWNVMLYSFLGFLLEVAYAYATGGSRDRKCLLVLPLCPVYGAGACLILMISDSVRDYPPLVFLLGAAAATAAEYLAALYYEKLLGVSFWNYNHLPGNFQGRVCPAFSLAWGFLSLPLVYWIQPVLGPWMEQIPQPVTWAAGAAVFADSVVSAALLRKHRSVSSLKWYA